MPIFLNLIKTSNWLRFSISSTMEKNACKNGKVYRIYGRESSNIWRSRVAQWMIVRTLGCDERGVTGGGKRDGLEGHLSRQPVAGNPFWQLIPTRGNIVKECYTAVGEPLICDHEVQSVSGDQRMPPNEKGRLLSCICRLGLQGFTAGQRELDKAL